MDKCQYYYTYKYTYVRQSLSVGHTTIDNFYMEILSFGHKKTNP